MTNRRLSILTGIVAVACAASNAFASGYENPSKGAKASSMAGAWVAQGDDLSVMDYNPSELVRQDRFTLEVHYTAYLFGASFEPDAVTGFGGGPKSENNADFVNHIPNLYGVYPWGKWRFGLGLFTPVGPRHTYSDSGAQRYQVQHAQLSLAWPTAAIAYQFNNHWAASLSLDVAYVDVTQTMALGLVPGFHSLDGSLTIEGSSINGPRPKAGVLFSPNDKWSFGLVALPGLDIEIKGKITADVPQAGLNGEQDNVTASQRFPPEVRLGAGWKLNPFRLELAARYFRWSEYKAQKVDLEHNRIGDFEVADLTVKKYYQDSYSASIGGGYRFLKDHEIRLGYGYDSQAAQDKGLTIQDFDAPKHIFAVGYGLDFLDGYYFNAAYNHIYYMPKKVTTSETEPIAVIGTPPRVGNGTYQWTVNTFAVQTGVHF